MRRWPGRWAKLAKQTPASFVVFDALALDGRDLRGVPQRERRVRLERALANVAPPVHLTPMTRDRAVATEWLSRVLRHQEKLAHA